jgi:hypothetical protein
MGDEVADMVALKHIKRIEGNQIFIENYTVPIAEFPNKL